MKNKFLISVCCLVLLFVCVTGSVSAARIEQYSYNGINFASFPTWDIEKYPCATLGKFVAMDSNTGAYSVKQDYALVVYTNNSLKTLSNDLYFYRYSNWEFQFYYYSLETNEWKLHNGTYMNNGNSSISFRLVEPFWTNNDLYNSSGNLALAKTMPELNYIELPVAYDDFKNYLSPITELITEKNVVAVLAWVVGSVVALPFMWWGVRKLVRMITSAWKKGKISL